MEGCASRPLDAGSEPPLPRPSLPFRAQREEGKGPHQHLETQVMCCIPCLLAPDTSWGSCSGWNAAGRLITVPMKDQACWVWTLTQSWGSRCSVLEHLVFTQLYPCYIIILWENINVIVTVLYGLEKPMAPHSSTLAWKIPWMEDPW